jgi:anti-anti-sigma regulatory factor
MEIKVSSREGRVPVTVFRLQGQLTEASYKELEQRAETEAAAGMRHLLLDLSEVSFVSSGGLRAIHHIFMLLRSDAPEDSDEAVHQGLRAGTYRSPHLKLLGVSPDVRKTLQQAGFDMFLEMWPDLEGAVASF